MLEEVRARLPREEVWHVTTLVEAPARTVVVEGVDGMGDGPAGAGPGMAVSYPLRPRFPINRASDYAVKLYVAMVKLALLRPWMVPTLMRTGWAFRARRWYFRPPFLPLPPRDYLGWRMDCAYGDPGASPPADDLKRFLGWADRMRSDMRAREIATAGRSKSKRAKPTTSPHSRGLGG